MSDVIKQAEAVQQKIAALSPGPRSYAESPVTSRLTLATHPAALHRLRCHSRASLKCAWHACGGRSGLRGRLAR